MIYLIWDYLLLELNSHVRTPTVSRKSLGKHKGRKNREIEEMPLLFFPGTHNFYYYNEIEDAMYFIKQRSLNSLCFWSMNDQSLITTILITSVASDLTLPLCCLGHRPHQAPARARE